MYITKMLLIVLKVTPLSICTKIPCTCYVCLLYLCFVFGFRALKFPAKTEKNWDFFCWLNLVCGQFIQYNTIIIYHRKPQGPDMVCWMFRPTQSMYVPCLKYPLRRITIPNTTLKGRKNKKKSNHTKAHRTSRQHAGGRRSEGETGYTCPSLSNIITKPV